MSGISRCPAGRARRSVVAIAAAGVVLAAAAGCSGAADASPGEASRSAADSPSPAPSSPAPSSPSPTPTPKPVPRPKVLMAEGAQGEQVRELQARLRQIAHFNLGPTGYYGPITAASVTSFQAKRGLPRTGRLDAVTWERLLAMTRQPSGSELYPPTTNVPEAPDPRCLTGRVLCVSKRSDTLRWMVDGNVLMAMDVRFGSQYTPTREGTFSVSFKSRHHHSTIYDTPMPYAMFFSGGQAVHYSADFAATGYNGASHGCVNVRDEGKIASLFGQVREGDKVVVYR